MKQRAYYDTRTQTTLRWGRIRVRALGKSSIIKFGDRRNQIAGMLVFTLGVFVIVESLNYDIGTAAQTGPGILLSRYLEHLTIRIS